MIKKKVLILGPSSQIGQSLVEERSPYIELIEASRQHIDLEKLDLIKEYIININPDIVINCAAYTNVDKAEEEILLSNVVNSSAVGEIVKGCNEIKATLIHFSTDYVFDGETINPYLESSTPNPLSVYGKSKYSGDFLIQSNSSNYFIFRISWIYGIHNNNFLKTIFNKIKSGDKLRVVDDQIGSPTPSKLVAQVVTNIIANFNLEDRKEILNLQPRGSTTWFGFANFINNSLDKTKKLSQDRITPVTSNEFNSKALRPKYSLLDTNKIEKLFEVKFRRWEDYALKEIKGLDKGA